MQRLWGWLSPATVERQSAQSDLTAMAAGPSTGVPPAVLVGDKHALAADSAACLGEQDNLRVAIVGRPCFAEVSGGNNTNPSAQLLSLWKAHGREALSKISGAFALAVVDSRENSIFLAIDRIGSHSLSFAIQNGDFIFGSRADNVAGHRGHSRQISLQSLFNYFYFYDVPAPGTIFDGVEKLLPGQYVVFQDGKLERQFYWHLKYRDEPRTDFDAMSTRFNTLLRDCVGRAAGNDHAAAFLSGGTDSSTIAGILSEVQKKGARTYSIGFSADGFDEMEYARIAVKQFGLDSREYYLQPDDVLAAIPIIAQHYDEPFANESAVPAYFCAKLAKDDGYQAILAGDGGDEIFGGNARYAGQKLFEAYQVIPPLLRHGLFEPIASIKGLGRNSIGRKFQGYIRQSKIPLPERVEAYNFVYRQPLDEMFAHDFLASVNPQIPSDWLKAVYNRTDSQSFINRMMHLDLKFTLADNDLRKVNGMTEAAGIEVRYPFLDDRMLEFSGEIPPDWKIRRFYLRWFFKKSLSGFLPEEIIKKRKHGFGLPFGVWARDHAQLRERMNDSLSAFNRRGWLQPAYVERLRTEHMSGHATYFGKMLWVLWMLEEWLEHRQL